jgi:hypothetical protein
MMIGGAPVEIAAGTRRKASSAMNEATRSFSTKSKSIRSTNEGKALAARKKLLSSGMSVLAKIGEESIAAPAGTVCLAAPWVTAPARY